MREHFRKRITELWDYPKISIPVRAGGRYFYVKNSGLQRQSPLYTRPNLTAPAALVLDPNVLSPDGSLSLAQWAPSHDGRLLAYGLSEGGADWRTLHVRDIDSGKDLPDEVRWMRFSDISWTNDGKGFFYSRFPEPPKGKALEAALSGQTVYYHRIGTPQAQDRLIYKREDLPTWFVGGKVTEDGRYLIVSIQKGSDNNNRVYYADLGDPMRPAIGAPIRPVIEDDDAEFAVFGNAGHVLYLRTDRASSNRKVIAVDLACPAQANWKTIIPEREQAIESVPLIGGRIVAQYLMDVQSRVSLFGLDGSAQGDLPLPGTGTVAGIGAVKTRRRYSTRSARRCLRRRYSSTIRDRLAQEDFTLLDNKVPQPIVSFHAQDAPTSVGIVLDTSESMRNVLRMAKEVLHAFLESANPQDDLFLMTVSSKPQILSSVTDDPDELESAIRSARAGGNTALIDTIRLAAEHIRKARNAQRALLIVSDGIDNRSRFSKTELLHTVVEIDAQIHTITFETTTPNRKPVEQVEEHRGLRFMDDLAERTGGLNFVVRSGSEAVDAAAKVARALRSQYVIGFRPADMDTSGKWHRIQIQVKLHDTHVSARNGYYAR